MTTDEFNAWADPIKTRLCEALGVDPKAMWSEPNVWATTGGGWGDYVSLGSAYVLVESAPCDIRKQTYKIPVNLTGDALEKKLATIIAKVNERNAQGKANQAESNRRYRARNEADAFRQKHRAAHGLAETPWQIRVSDEGTNETDYRAKVTFQWLTAEQAKAMIERYNEISKND